MEPRWPTEMVTDNLMDREWPELSLALGVAICRADEFFACAAPCGDFDRAVRVVEAYATALRCKSIDHPQAGELQAQVDQLLATARDMVKRWREGPGGW